MKISKRKFTIYFFGTVAFLALVRLIFPGVAMNGKKSVEKEPTDETIAANSNHKNKAAFPMPVGKEDMRTIFTGKDGKEVKSRIYSVPGFEASFPDQNDVQLLAAEKWGVRPVADSADASKHLSSLVYIGANPYFHIDRLRDSSPFLVPRAAVLTGHWPQFLRLPSREAHSAAQDNRYERAAHQGRRGQTAKEERQRQA